jgi:hypothetical protein
MKEKKGEENEKRKFGHKINDHQDWKEGGM